MLPKSLDGLSEETLQQWRRVESSLVGREISVPVYFTFDSKEAHELRRRVEHSSDDALLVVPGDTTVTRINGMQGINYQVLRPPHNPKI